MLKSVDLYPRGSEPPRAEGTLNRMRVSLAALALAVTGATETFFQRPDASRRDYAPVPLTLARLLLFHHRFHGDMETVCDHDPAKTACESEQTLSVQRSRRRKVSEQRSHS